MWVFILSVYGKIIFLYMDKYCTLTYWRLTSFVVLFAYLGFLDTRLSLDLSLFPIPLVLRYRVTSGSRFYQTWFSDFWVVIYFIESCLTTWSRGLHQFLINSCKITTNLLYRLSWRAWCRMTELPPGIKGSFGFNHKVMIIGFRSRHLVLWSLGT